MPLTLQEIAVEVGEWSRRNFKDQESKRYFQPVILQQTRLPVKLLSLAPFLGLVEELGEFADAVFTDPKETEDALGDIGIYLCDFGQRDGVDFSEIEPVHVPHSKMMSIASPLGKLAHCVLKSHQGIRGFDDLGFYIEKRNEALKALLESLHHRSMLHVGKPFVTIVEETWQRVKLRDWQKNNKSAHLVEEDCKICEDLDEPELSIHKAVCPIEARIRQRNRAEKNEMYAKTYGKKEEDNASHP